MFKLPFFTIDKLTGRKALEFTKDLIWLNTKPLKLKNLFGENKIVLLDFWTYSCVNCLRTLPYLKHWHEKYNEFGLVIIGVHSPEFEFEKAPHNVLDFVLREKINYPVVLDDEYQVWNLYSNHYWPRKLLVDVSGRVRYDKVGEGSYAETEKQIQQLLQETNPRAVFERVVPETEHLGGSGSCYPSTPEVYCGYKRGSIGNPEGYFRDRKFEYRYLGSYEDGKIYLEGTWLTEAQVLKHASVTNKYRDFLSLRFHGVELNSVMNSSPGKGEEVVVTLDDKKIPEEFRGKDIKVKDESTVVVVSEPRMYNLIKANKYGSYVIKLSSKTDSFQIYAFTFGGCTH